MKILILILAFLSTDPPKKKLLCTGKAHEVETNFLSSDSHDYYLYFEDGTIVKTSRKYYACYERGDSAVFFYRDILDSNNKHKRYEWQMINKCPHELQ